MISTDPTPSAALRAHWWVPLVRGIVAIAFGVVLFALPISAVFTFVVLFGAFALVDGALAIVTALWFAHPDRGRWWLLVVQGLAGIAFGILTFTYPGITATTLGLFIAAWAIVTGVLEIGAGIRVRRDVPREIFLLLAGVLSIVLGIALFAFPLGALLALVYAVGAYGVISGCALVAFALRLRRGPTAPVGVTPSRL
jgi:uncharacterized membrane protein HdeD (DUF308 family)